MICTFKEGDRVVVIDNEQHGTVKKVKFDDRGEPLVYVDLDDASFGGSDLWGPWTARTFELREEGEQP
jgi:hypothetical protein